jgi:hypothetical protein
MINVFRLSFEVPKEGRIFNKFKHLKRQFAGVVFGASPDANWRGQFDQDADRKRQLWVPGFG